MILSITTRQASLLNKETYKVEFTKEEAEFLRYVLDENRDGVLATKSSELSIQVIKYKLAHLDKLESAIKQMDMILGA